MISAGVPDSQTTSGPPAIAVGGVVIVTARVLAALDPHELPAVTEILPFCPAVPVFTVMEAEPAPAVMVHPAGTFQV